MYSQEKYGITFQIDARVELIFGMLSKLKKENSELEEELDFVESFNTEYYSDYANRMYEIIDFKKYPKMLKWALKLSQVPSCDIVPNVAMMISDNFESKEITKDDEYFQKFFIENNYDEFINDINEFVIQTNYLSFYYSNFDEYSKMVNESTKDAYPSNLDVKDIEKCYGEKLEQYLVIYSIFFNGGFGPTIDKVPVCFKGLWIKDSKYIESTSGIINLYHEYSHHFINPLVDKYWSNFDNVEGFVDYSIQNNLHPTYQKKAKTLYYEYYVRAMSYILSSKYEDIKEAPDYWSEKLGFVKIWNVINYIEENLKIGQNFEEFFSQKLIPFTNKLTRNLEEKKKNR